MKKLLIISLAILLASCNPFISKDLRQKNKCNRKIERELKRHKKKSAKINIKCPGAIVNDTIHDTLRVEVPATDIDSFIVIERDTALIDSLVNLIKNKKTRRIIRDFITEYIPIKDTIIHLADGYTIKFWATGGKINYTIDKPEEIVEKVSEIIVKELKPIPLTTWQKIMNGAKDFWWVLILFLVLLVLGRLAWKKLM